MAASSIERTTDIKGWTPAAREFISRFLWAVGNGAPTNATDGANEAEIGAQYFDQVTGKSYRNAGTKASPTWNEVGQATVSEVTIAEGNILIGNSSGVGVALDIGNTNAGIAIGNGTTATIAALSGDVTMSNAGAVTIAAGAVEESMLTAASLTGLVAATVADDNVIGGIPVVHRITMASGADANTDVTLTHKTRILDAWFVLAGAGTAGSAVLISDATNTIVASIDVSAGADQAIFRAAKIDDAYHEIAAAGTLRANHVSTGADFPGAECYVLGIRVA